MRLSLVLLWLSAAAACGPGRGFNRRQGPRRVIPLVFGQHDPNINENKNTASGPPEGRITRDDERFKDLVPNYNPDIDFRDDEGTGADRLMTQRCKEKLNTLAISVMNQWPGVRLRVIEGWDEENSHLDKSLHYEGRAVDLTTSDRDRSKYGMLARLAVEAGFDWVFYESRSYIHCSVKTGLDALDDSARPSVGGALRCAPPSSPGGPSGAGSLRPLGCAGAQPPAPTATTHSLMASPLLSSHLQLNESSVGTGAGCFPSGSMVHTKEGPRDISSIKIGDSVLAAGDDGKLIYSEVLTFIDRDPNATRQFVEITAENGVTISSTPSHLLLLAAADGWRESFAINVEEGDVLLTRGQAGVMRPSKVVKTNIVLKRGVYAPLTKAGTIIVDDVLASCYALVQSHSLAHAAMAPLRWMAGWNTLLPATEGVHWYASALYRVGDYVLPSSYRFR